MGAKMAISTVLVEPTGTLTETTSVPDGFRRFRDLRGVQWRIDLGILPSSPSSSIDDLRRVTADSRRRYAALRRQLLVDPHLPKDGSSPPDPVMDNPLSQNPDSMWGRFFKNAELERMLDKDLTRLYPEHSSYFQTSGCQGMLRRILLLWCLRHPEYGYRQGMHELLAPLLYVLHIDTERLSKVRKTYEDHFTDKFDGFSFHEKDLTYKFDFKKFSESMEDGHGSGKCSANASNIIEIDTEIQTVVLLSDAYGAEGELGVVLSGKFMEHDAYCMFDALMNGSGGVVAMAEFFPPPFGSSLGGFPPVIEASGALYHLLSIVDSSLHSHLVELGIEPQYFALRWLRVLFGREFALEDLLIIWDEIFACRNSKLSELVEDNMDASSGVLGSSRGTFISAFAVSMVFHLRSSLLATENATSCLQRLLNFPDDVKLDKLIRKAKSLQPLALDAINSNPLLTQAGLFERSKPAVVRGHRLSLDSSSPRTPLTSIPDSYWEEKWRSLHKEEECKQDALEKHAPSNRKAWSGKVKLHLSRTESDPSSSSVDKRKKEPKLSVRRNLLEDLARQLGADEDIENIVRGKPTNDKDQGMENDQNFINENLASTSEQICLTGNVGSEVNSSISSDPPSPVNGVDDHGQESGRSSVASNSSIGENDAGTNTADLCPNNPEGSVISVSDTPHDVSLQSSQNDESAAGGKLTVGLKERKLLYSKFQRFWKFGRFAVEGMSEKGQATEIKGCSGGIDHENISGASTANGGVIMSSGCSKGETVDQNMMAALGNLGQSMLENIQVIESVFQQDRAQAGASKSILVGKGQVTAMAALKELRKISNLLSEM